MHAYVRICACMARVIHINNLRSLLTPMAYAMATVIYRCYSYIDLPPIATCRCTACPPHVSSKHSLTAFIMVLTLTRMGASRSPLLISMWYLSPRWPACLQ